VTVRVLLLIVVCSIAALPCAAAPAPFPRANPPAAEVVFDATTPERARLVAAYLRSWGFAQTLADSAAGKEHLAHLKTFEQRRDWFRDRLRVTSDGKLIRVRLEHRSGAMAALRRVTGQLVSPPADPDEDPRLRQMVVVVAAMRRMELANQMEQLRRGPRKLTAEEMEVLAAQLGRYEIEANPLKLHAAPRDVGRRR
jgi:hypothetical protein